MGSEVFELVVTVLAAWGVARLIAGRLKPGEPAEPGDFAHSPAKIGPRPRSGSGAIALAEPDEEDEEMFDQRPRRANQR